MMLRRSVIGVLIGLFLAGTLSCVPQTGVKKTPSGAAAVPSITGVAIRQTPAGTELLLNSKAPLRYTAYLMSNPDRLLVELPDTRIDPKLVGRPLKGKGPVKQVQIKTASAKNTKHLFVTVLLKQRVEYDAVSRKDGLSFVLKPATASPVFSRKTAAVKESKPPAGQTAGTARAPASRPPSPAVPKVRIQTTCTTDQKGRLLCKIVSPADFKEVKRFTLTNPDRLVVDLYGIRPMRSLETVEVGRRELKEIRIGSHDDKTRVVLEFPKGERPEAEIKEGKREIQVVLRSTTPPVAPPSSAVSAPVVAAPAAPVAGKKQSPAPVTASAAAPAAPEKVERTARLAAPATPPAPSLPPQAPSPQPVPEKRSTTASEMEQIEPLEDMQNVSVLSGKPNDYVGSPITITMRDMDIREFFDFLADYVAKYHPREGRINFIISDNVQGRVSMKLNNIPWDQALDMVLEAHRLKKIRRSNNVIWITTEDDYNRIQKEREQARLERIRLIAEQKKAFADRIKEERRAAAQHELRRAQQESRYAYIPVMYADAEKNIKPVLDELIKTYYNELYKDLFQVQKKEKKKEMTLGNIQVDKRTNTIIVYATPDVIKRCEEIVKKLDKPIRQVLLQARIVEVRSDFKRELGISWGGQYKRADGANRTGISGAAGETVSTTEGGGEASTKTGVTNPLVNVLPVGSATGGLGVTFGRIIGASLLQIDARLEALENENKATIISSPKIVALDNTEAVIVQGQQFPLITRDKDFTLHAVYRDAALKLRVTPRVVPNSNRITVDLKLEEKQIVPGSEARNELGNPTLQTKEARTVMLLNSGETMVIGGITSQTKGGSQRRVPCLGNLPGVGWLFKSDSKSDEKKELLMFITPTLLDSPIDSPTPSSPAGGGTGSSRNKE